MIAIIAVIIAYMLTAWLLAKLILPILNLVSFVLIGETIT